jgi:hypothetical protein
MDCTQFDALLHSHAYGANHRSLQHAKDAENAVAAKEADQGAHHGINAENRLRLDMEHDRKINEHTGKAKSWAQVSDAAAHGYLLHRPGIEGSDAAYTHQHSDMISCARKSGRLVDAWDAPKEEGNDCPCDES